MRQFNQMLPFTFLKKFGFANVICCTRPRNLGFDEPGDEIFLRQRKTSEHKNSCSFIFY